MNFILHTSILQFCIQIRVMLPNVQTTLKTGAIVTKIQVIPRPATVVPIFETHGCKTWIAGWVTEKAA